MPSERPAKPEVATFGDHEVITPDTSKLRKLVRPAKAGDPDPVANAEAALAAIYGSEDAIYRELWADVEGFLRALPALRRFELVEGAGDWVQYEDAAAFDAALLAALQAVGVSAAAPTSPTGS